MELMLRGMVLSEASAAFRFALSASEVLFYVVAVLALLNIDKIFPPYKGE